MSHKMFRYLEKYCGKYRVLAPYDLDTLDFPREENGSIDENFDDLYIPCKRGIIKASYDSPRGHDMLCIYFESGQTGENVRKEIEKQFPDIEITIDNVGRWDYYIYFDSEDLDKIATIVKPSTYGARIRPFSTRNLPSPKYTIPEDQLQQLTDIYRTLTSHEKMIFMRAACSEFDEVIQKKKGKRYDISKARKTSKLKNKEFIHSLGLWDDFIEFVKNKFINEFGEK